MATLTSKHKPYPAYKPSGVEWLGDIPVQWEVRRLRNLAEMRVSNVDKHIKNGELPVRLCNYVDVYKNDRITKNLVFMPATANADEIDRFRLETGDVLITKDSETWDDIGVPSLVQYTADDLVCGYHLALLRPLKTALNGAYLLRALQVPTVAYQFHSSSNGVTRYGLTHEAIKSVRLPVPPLPEQRAIAAFLDRETGKIDALISKKERLVELLQEKRTALISHAVTMGLDPNAPMKESGVEWLGKVPANWEVRRLKNSVADYVGGVWGSEPNGVDDLPCVRVADFDRHRLRVCMHNPTLRAIVPDDRRRRVLNPSDLLLEKSGGGDLQPVGAVMLYDHGTPAVCSNFIARLRIAVGFDPAFLTFLHSALYAIRLNARSIKQTTGIQNLDTSAYLRELVCFPPLAEQRAIVAFLNHETAKLDSLIAKVKKAIELLKESRTALISAAVTGRIDVREEMECT